ncbi:hypothetical protein ES708_10766 [subsurface metagenome]
MFQRQDEGKLDFCCLFPPPLSLFPTYVPNRGKTLLIFTLIFDKQTYCSGRLRRPFDHRRMAAEGNGCQLSMAE